MANSTDPVARLLLDAEALTVVAALLAPDQSPLAQILNLLAQDMLENCYVLDGLVDVPDSDEK